MFASALIESLISPMSFSNFFKLNLLLILYVHLLIDIGSMIIVVNCGLK